MLTPSVFSCSFSFFFAAHFPVESGRNEAITTEGQEINNWTKVSAILWYRRPKSCDLSRDNTVTMASRPLQQATTELLSNFRSKFDAQIWIGQGGGTEQLDDLIGNTLVSVCGNSAFARANSAFRIVKSVCDCVYFR
jgi:hypothetical protein